MWPVHAAGEALVLPADLVNALADLHVALSPGVSRGFGVVCVDEAEGWIGAVAGVWALLLSVCESDRAQTPPGGRIPFPQ